jgi:hypothetical protein
LSWKSIEVWAFSRLAYVSKLWPVHAHFCHSAPFCWSHECYWYEDTRDVLGLCLCPVYPLSMAGDSIL